jgi:hypothetical protein
MSDIFVTVSDVVGMAVLGLLLVMVAGVVVVAAVREWRRK